MKIVLSEERNGQYTNQRSFDVPTIKIGRDPAECHIVFDQTQYPMVSRKHAEIRFKDGKCYLVDTNSSFGTYVEKNRVTEPFELHAGQRIQLGAAGPVLFILGIDAKTEAAQGATVVDLKPQTAGQPGTPPPRPTIDVPAKQAAPPPAPQKPAPTPGPPPAQMNVAAIEIVNAMSGKLERFPLTKPNLRLGRDPASDVCLDAAAAVVSRSHAEIKLQNGKYILVDLGSFNGTLLNDLRITQPSPLFNGDRIQLGMGGPILRFVDQSGSRTSAGTAPKLDPALAGASVGQATMVFRPGSGSLKQKTEPVMGGAPQLRLQRLFEGRNELSIGRAPDNDIPLDGLQISNHHARVTKADGNVFIEDRGSTNGVHVNGQRVSGRVPIRQNDVVQIGPFLIQADPERGVAVFDTRSKTRIDCIDITKIVSNRSGGGKIKLLDDVDLTILPNEFVGLLGPSGAGKSTLMDSLNGMRPATSGHVLVNNLDLYRHLDSIKQSIGYVPQDDIIHRELTVYRTLYYVARLRLSRDVSTKEIDQIVGEVMDVTGLAERRDVPVAQLSGGQRKRVSIAVELITKPSVIYLDEPTSGLDPATEEKIMKLFRQIAESGRTVILTTHAMENVKLFDKIVVMMRGKLVFYGGPQESLAHIGADSFKDLYDKLEAPIDERIAQMPALPPNATAQQKAEFKRRKEQVSEEVAEEWKQRFQRTETYQRNIVQPLSGIRPDAAHAAPARRRTKMSDSIRQWGTLARRYIEVLSRDKFNMLILLAQAPIIAFLTYLVVDADAPRDFPYFMCALVAIWFGTSVSAREIIRERAVYNRERMVNLGLLPYVGSKLFVLSMIVGLQCVFLFGTLKALHYVGLMDFPGWALPQLVVIIITGVVGITIGLFISAVVKTSEMATSLVPLILIPQILFSGLVGVPTGISKLVGVAMPATWAFDEMKRLSTLDTLKEEGSDEEGPNKGRGLYKHVEDLNDQNIAKARKDIERYKDDATENSKEFERDMDEFVRKLRAGQSVEQPKAPKLGSPPAVPDAEKLSDNLSNYVAFKHPWGNVVTNPIMLMFMFFVMLIATLIALKAQDIG